MSADNTIVILELRGEYRVGHFTAIENLNWSWVSFSLSEKINPVRLFEYFQNSQVFNTYSEAEAKARELYDKYIYVEYGIRIITINKTFNEITRDAQVEISKEIENIRTQNRDDILEDLLETRIKLDKYFKERL